MQRDEWIAMPESKRVQLYPKHWVCFLTGGNESYTSASTRMSCSFCLWSRYFGHPIKMTMTTTRNFRRGQAIPEFALVADGQSGDTCPPAKEI